MPRLRNAIINLALVLLSLVAGLGMLELGIRAASPNASVLQWRNLLDQPLMTFGTMPFLRYDSEIGYVIDPDGRRFGLSLGPLGNRLDHTPPAGQAIPAPAPNSILAVGDSFVYGSEVEDDETWPALLGASIMGQSVVNAGVGGWGLDQITLWAKRLIPVLKPPLVLVGINPFVLERCELSRFAGMPKPYFRLTDEGVEMCNVPVSPPQPRPPLDLLRRVLGYSYLAYSMTERLGLGDAWRLTRYARTVEHHDGAAVACHLIRQLDATTRSVGGRLVVVLQVARGHLHDPVAMTALNTIRDCAAMAVTVIDTRPDFAALPDQDLERMFAPGGHLSAAGNRLVAKHLATELR
ncbi:MAG: SGNH/GDSL hydrolase family protein [Phaeospirillum sp.]|nr:SGNH/GDSL hydrolase family protein [Phaeospirillum sp.]